MSINAIEKSRLVNLLIFYLLNILKSKSIYCPTDLIDPPISDPIPIKEPAAEIKQPSPPELPPTILFQINLFNVIYINLCN
jgi:hypothetical protein